jgi:hypothetical protein
METLDRLRSVVLPVAIGLLIIAADRFINMAWIGRPSTTCSIRAFVYQASAAAGVTLILLAMVLGRRR